MFASAHTVAGGFANPVFDAQAVFRSVMDAMARPGSVSSVAPLALPPAPLLPTAAAVALTLCDHDTPLWLDPGLAASDAARAYLTFHTGAPLTDRPAEAAFALVSQPLALLALDRFSQGTQEYPDRSTTLILQVGALAAEAGAHPAAAGRFTRLWFEGPGIETVSGIACAPLPQRFVEQWRENRARFPRGVDLVLAGPNAVACLPRTARLVRSEG